MFRTLQATFNRDKDYPARQFRVSILGRVLDGTIYDNLPHPFHNEKAENGEYVPLRQRRPSVRYRLCGLVVDDSVSLLFSEAHFPIVQCEDEATREGLAKIIKEACLNAVMIEAATRGSVGSVAILMRVLKRRVFFSVMTTEFLTPTWQADAPDTLEKVTELYKVKGDVLRPLGYTVKDDELKSDFWFCREWTATEETWFLPLLADAKKDGAAFERDAERSVVHSLGFVPMVWVKNLPGGDEIDGACTFPPEAIDTGIEVDYQLSQAGRGLKYSSDPTLIIKEPAVGENGQIIKGAGNAIVVGKDGDAKMLEINGDAVEAVLAYVAKLRELALESMHGNRTSADKISAAQSGRAMELMNQALIWLADRLRISYGEGALLSLLQMIVKVGAKLPLEYKDGTKVGNLDAAKPLSLRWPAWYQPTADDAKNKADTLTTLTDGGVISEETATKAVAADYDIEDVKAERTQIEIERKAREANAEKQVKITE